MEISVPTGRARRTVFATIPYATTPYDHSVRDHPVRDPAGDLIRIEEMETR